MPATASSVKSIRTATMDDVPAIARVLGRAFYGDPLFRWFFPGNETRMARSIRMCALTAGFDLVPDGEAHVFETDEDGRRVVRGAGLWKPPGDDAKENATMLRSLPHLASMLGVRHLPRVMRYIADLKGSVPEEPHWHLRAMGTDPAARGTGVGSSLLRAGLAQADTDGVPVYLYTTNPANIGFYERFDFRVVRAVNDPDFPSTYCMLRPSV
ncbi:MAG TPA: GNAT family N-acetyltransferase [Nocardiopsis listeri]|uniref:GNAT family N-acetyltransferase n=1 Tax=Nocardiopsis listeri TaxID=53440 RepID=UPI001D802957|nr:GNAT family N-acetyltransferase [Nocardiopsis listeri]HJE59897.1 GNAT family N-acetyltransferase [Nocardiopsis listeri]